MKAADIVNWLKQHVAQSANLCLDTRQLLAGDVFFACPGRASDGRTYIEDAVGLGATAIVYESEGAPEGASSFATPALAVTGLSGLLGEVADAWYGRPSDSLYVIAVTGTNGKTSSVQWIAAALNAAQTPCGSIGTLGVFLPDGTSLGGVLTTPDVLTVHRSLAAMRNAGAEAVAMEASSIGLALGRLDAVQIDIAAFTNLTHDHLDFHGDLDRYREAKYSLFQRPGLQAAVFNIDDPVSAEWIARSEVARTLSYSLSANKGATLAVEDLQTGASGLIFNLVADEGRVQLLTHIVGEHNVANFLLVACVLRTMGWDLTKTARILSGLRSVPGRLEVVHPSRGAATLTPLVVVDYAHTPDAMEHTLSTLRGLAEARGGKLVSVFGCGGNRDTGKRPIMGRISSQLADITIITQDNPRREAPDVIVAQIREGAGPDAQVELDRAQAILKAIWRAQPNDVIAITGKGHETYQEIGDQRLPFDDREWAKAALTWLAVDGCSTDTRQMRPGQLFIALKGENFAGHDFLEQARQAGAIAAVVHKPVDGVELEQIALGDTRRALIEMARAWRQVFDLALIAVTGSNGKTTTKEMVASILRQSHGETGSLATAGNYNNDIGVPLTLMRLRASHHVAVLELGMNHPGEIALLADMARPTIALVNNAQREHQEFMQSVQAVAEENGAVIAALPQDGVAVFPGDDAHSAVWETLAKGRRALRFGLEPHYEVFADQIHVEPGHTSFQINTPLGSANISLPAPGLHNLRNALAAAACCVAADIALDDIVQGLQAFRPVQGRMQPRHLAQGYQLIDDSYNANPDSVRAAIDVLAGLEGPRILVLGDMAEVGANSDAMHAEVGAYARERGLEALFGVGPGCRHAVQAFGENGQTYASIDELVPDLLQRLPAHVLVKGSRSARMERVVQAVEQAAADHQGGRNAS